MAFEDALLQAKKLGGTTVKFAQGIDCCTGFTARWLKHQLMGKDFWANPKGSKPPILTPSLVKVTLKSGESFPTDKAQMTLAGNDKIQAIYDRIDQTGIDRNKAGKGTAGYLASSKSFGTLFDGIGLKQQPWKLPSPSIACQIADLYYHGGFHLSLQVDFALGSGVNPLFGGGGTSFHSVAAFRKGGEVKFFDPNMGEVTLPREKFGQWFEFLQSAWGKDKMYAKFDLAVLTYIRGLNALSEMGTEARRRLKRRLQIKQGYELRTTTKRPAAAALGPPPVGLPPPPPDDMAAFDAQLALLAQATRDLDGDDG